MPEEHVWFAGGGDSVMILDKVAIGASYNDVHIIYIYHIMILFVIMLFYYMSFLI